MKWIIYFLVVILLPERKQAKRTSVHCQIFRHHASIIRVHTGFYLSLSLCDYILIWVSCIIQHILKNGRILVFRTFPPHYWTGKKVRRKTGFRLRWHPGNLATIDLFSFFFFIFFWHKNDIYVILTYMLNAEQFEKTTILKC